MNGDLRNVWGDPFELRGIRIYPVKMGQAMFFYENIGCFLLNKNSVQDPEIIRLDYLQFILKLGKKDSRLLSGMIAIMKLVLRNQEFEFDYDKKGKVILVITDENGEKFDLTGELFDEVRKIILNQNLIKFDDELMNPEVKKALDEAKEFMNKRNKNKQSSIEEQIVAYHCAMGLGYKEIRELSIYQFFKGLERKSLMIHSDIIGTAIATGAASLKDEMPTWLDHIPNKEEYDDIKMSEEEFNELTSDKDLFSK